MASDASTNAGKHVMSNIACARSQRYTIDTGFWLAQMTLRVITLRNFPAFCRNKPNLKWSDKRVVDTSITKLSFFDERLYFVMLRNRPKHTILLCTFIVGKACGGGGACTHVRAWRTWRGRCWPSAGRTSWSWWRRTSRGALTSPAFPPLLSAPSASPNSTFRRCWRDETSVHLKQRQLPQTLG